MAIPTEQAAYRPAGRFWPFGVSLLWLALAMMLTLSGCGGCRKTPEAEEQEKQQAEEKARQKKEKEKEPFEAQKPVVIPSVKDHAGMCKPGHWIGQVWPDVKANRSDFQGELQTEIAGMGERRVPLVGVPYELTDERPAPLAKEQPKSLESFVWIPLRQDARFVNFKLAAGGGPAVLNPSMGLEPMPSYRYWFVVLSRAAGRYEYLDKRLDSIHAGRSQPGDTGTGTKFYEVVSMPAGAPGTPGRRPSLPTNALYWTSIAYVLWDDFDPALWDVDQQQALVDWLHWGGQIIVSGPDALEQLRNSFLRPYLPATVQKARTFTRQDLAELSYWAGDELGRDSPKVSKPWPGAVLIKDKDPLAQFLPFTADTLVERQVGRGRIVASAFRLTGLDLTAWPGYDCLFNACLLRRPAREFTSVRDQDLEESRFIRWADSKGALQRLDAAKMTAVRYFARDTGVACEDYASDILKRAAENSLGPEDEGDSSSPDKVAPGLGAWNDFSPVAQAAREALQIASGIKVPERAFIVWVVVGYLCVLVPANWIVFRLLGRVEWAWIAAPLIAIACTAVVIDLAQLNVGFARSRNEIAVVEMQCGYSRVHVARYTALYTSLATRYEFHLDDPAAQILPFSKSRSLDEALRFEKEKEQSLFGTRGELLCRRGDDTQLTGFSVPSNATDYVHSENMFDFGGTVTLHRDSDGELHVTNGTPHPLDDCQAIRGESGSDQSDDIELARIGRLEPGATAPLQFEPSRPRKRPPSGDAHDELGGPSYQRPQGADPTGELSVQRVADVAIEKLELRPGEICLLARIVDEVSGLTVSPGKGQSRQAALLVAHLDAGRIPAPEADTKGAVSNPQGVDPGYLNPSRRRSRVFPPTTVPQTPTPSPEQ